MVGIGQLILLVIIGFFLFGNIPKKVQEILDGIAILRANFSEKKVIEITDDGIEEKPFDNEEIEYMLNLYEERKEEIEAYIRAEINQENFQYDSNIDAILVFIRTFDEKVLTGEHYVDYFNTPLEHQKGIAQAKARSDRREKIVNDEMDRNLSPSSKDDKTDKRSSI